MKRILNLPFQIAHHTTLADLISVAFECRHVFINLKFVKDRY